MKQDVAIGQGEYGVFAVSAISRIRSLYVQTCCFVLIKSEDKKYIGAAHIDNPNHANIVGKMIDDLRKKTKSSLSAELVGTDYDRLPVLTIFNNSARLRNSINQALNNKGVPYQHQYYTELLPMKLAAFALAFSDCITSAVTPGLLSFLCRYAAASILFCIFQLCFSKSFNVSVDIGKNNDCKMSVHPQRAVTTAEDLTPRNVYDNFYQSMSGRRRQWLSERSASSSKQADEPMQDVSQLAVSPR